MYLLNLNFPLRVRMCVCVHPFIECMHMCVCVCVRCISVCAHMRVCMRLRVRVFLRMHCVCMCDAVRARASWAALNVCSDVPPPSPPSQIIITNVLLLPCYCRFPIT